MAKEKDAPVEENKPNANKSYKECKLTVETVMEPQQDGSEKLSHYVMEPGKVIKTVKIEPHRAQQLNRSAHTRKIIYLPESDEMPAKIHRSYKWDKSVKDFLLVDEFIKEGAPAQ